MSALTTTQHSALGDLQDRGHLIASRTAWDDRGRRAYSARTLQALVAAGHARWAALTIETPETVAHRVGIVPGAACTECQEAAAEYHGMCPSCIHDARRSGWEPGQ